MWQYWTYLRPCRNRRFHLFDLGQKVFSEDREPYKRLALNLFRYCSGIIHFNAQIFNRAFDLGIASTEDVILSHSSAIRSERLRRQTINEP
jgi:hypothetical protein